MMKREGGRQREERRKKGIGRKEFRSLTGWNEWKWENIKGRKENGRKGKEEGMMECNEV